MWPLDTVMRLVFPDLVGHAGWTATVDGARLVFNITPVMVTAVPELSEVIWLIDDEPIGEGKVRYG